jgi:hypothetical protein
MNNIDSTVELLKAEMEEEFSTTTAKELCELLKYAHTFRKEFMTKRTKTFS